MNKNLSKYLDIGILINREWELTLEERIEQILILKPIVKIYKNNELHENYIYAIVIKDFPDFWLNAFKTEKEAKNYIKKHKLRLSK